MPGDAPLIAEPLFLALTRPAMTLGVTYSAFLLNALVTIQLFLFTKSLPWILVCVPIHGVFWLLCLGEPRFLDLLLLRVRSRAGGVLTNVGWWRASSYSPLAIEGGARRRRNPHVVL